MAPNGNCFYASILHGVNRPKSFGPMDMRRQVCLFLCEEAPKMYKILEPIIRLYYGDSQDPFSFSDFIYQISRPNSWGDLSLFVTVAYMWQITLTVFDSKTWRVYRIRHAMTEWWKCDITIFWDGEGHFFGSDKSDGRLLECGDLETVDSGSSEFTAGDKINKVYFLFSS